MTPAEREALVERVVSAHRPPDPRGGLLPSAAFHDLDDEGRREAFDATVAQRRLEAALDPDGLSSTAHAILARIAAASRGA